MHRNIKLLRDNIEENLCDIGDLGFSDEFLDTTLKAQWKEKKKTHKLDFIKFNNLCFVKDIGERMKREATD